ncbi:helix-turn-helix domain-containing protein [Tumebacillus permanentifrigoris]|uniref:Transcriptional regulator with XRE-family HTH domain n=1 Tax=Tumebacillus permanentifrigoris TaxID=378543 RepID=A0A316DVT5_9BACL|nr:helix-turn-helix transcriptional regulator [Tumebacillus permanentifrigoris]PWK13455.1 transcriptional regulator with XRE-family HTH domain [Tumebacillus permanentifrigoris]
MIPVHELSPYIGENLKKYRLANGMRQEELCEGVCSVSQLSKIENGKAQVKAEHLKIMAERLGVTVEQLMTTDAIHDELRDQIELTKKATVARNYAQAYELIRSVITRAQANGYQDLHAEAVLYECYLLSTTDRNCQAALLKLRETLTDGGEFDPITRADLLIEYGRIYACSGDLVEAFRQYLQADTLLQHLQPIADDHYAQVLDRLSTCMFDLQNWHSGYRYAERCAQIATARNLRHQRLRSLAMQATYASKLGRSEEAKRLLEASLQEAVDYQFIHEIAVLENNLGCWYLEQGELDTAHQCLQRSMTAFQQLDNPAVLYQPLLNLAEWAQKAGNYEHSLQFAQRALDLVHASSLPGPAYLIEGRILTMNAKSYELLGDPERKTALYEQALNLYDQNRAIIPAYEVCVTLAEHCYERNDPRALSLYKQAVGYNRTIHELGVKK